MLLGEENTMKKFKINNKVYVFSSTKFSEYFCTYRNNTNNRIKDNNEYEQKEKMTVGDLEDEIAKFVSVEKSTVHSWKFGPSGPSDIEIIKKITEFFGLEDVKYLMKEEKDKMKLTDLQLCSIKKIYDSIVSFLNEFDLTDGFTTSLWDEYVNKLKIKYINTRYTVSDDEVEEEINLYIESLIDNIRLVFRQEYFYLHDLLIYNELINYVDEALPKIYCGKLGCAYRREAIHEGNPTTQEDYDKAMDTLNSIIENCISN